MFRGLPITVALTLVVGATAAARPAVRAAAPRTIATTPGVVEALAQDGRHIAWINPSARCGRQVQMLTLPGRRPVYLGSRRGRSCQELTALGSIAVAGTKVVWQALSAVGNTEADIDFFTASLGNRGAQLLKGNAMERETSDPAYAYEPPLPMAGDGRALLFYSLCNFEGCRDESVVRRVVGRRTRRIASVFHPRGLAVAGGRVAYMTNNRICCNYDARFSPDGTQVAWSHFGDLRIVRSDGTGDRQLTTLRATRFPAWSPDGREIAFASQNAGDQEIDVVKPDGTGLRRVVSSGSWPEWSPDGMKIAFLRGNDVYVIRRDGTGELRLTTDGRSTQPLTWSHDSTRIAVTRRGDIWSVRADGGGQTLLTINPPSAVQPAWSPDGSKIAWAAGTSGPEGIYVINADGGARTRLTTDADEFPAWSADSSKLAFVRNANELWVMNASGSGQRRLTPRSQVYDRPYWARDGSSILIGDDESDSTFDPGVRLVSTTDGSLRRIAPARQSPVEIRSTTGALIKRFTIDGHAYGIALGGTYVALLVYHDPGVKLELYYLNGSFRQAVSVAGGARNVSAAGHNVVFDAGRAIRRLDTRTGTVSTLATARSRPAGPALEGRRVVWAETFRGSSRIRAVTAP